MSYTVGLDFGTHQTKICIEDASNPAQKIYEFFECDDPNGGKTVLFPSIVQINDDDTISYGFIDDHRCKVMSPEPTPKPVLGLPEEPKLILPGRPEPEPCPPKPKKDNLKGHSIKEQIAYQERYKNACAQWEILCKDINERNKRIYEEWELDCIGIKNDYPYDVEEYERERKRKQADYDRAVSQWENHHTPRKQLFRYFKLATFSKQYWPYEIDPEIISAWYLTYLLFKVQEKIGPDFYTQMGVPYSMGERDCQEQKSIAFKILIAANRLIFEYKSLDNFLRAKYTELLDNTVLMSYSEQDILGFGINVIPEAFAGLTSITQKRKLNRGMHLLIDIGGGTTDIAFFTITDNNLPNIHAVLSFAIGLNYIFEEYAKTSNSQTIAEVEQKFRKKHEEFDEYISLYHNILKCQSDEMISRIEKEFLKRQPIHEIDIRKLKHALSNQPVVYSGGGSLYGQMRVKLQHFTDVRLINKELLNIPYVKNENIDDRIFTILATSYGLSIQSEEEIKMTHIEEVFDHLPPKEGIDYQEMHKEHGLADT